MSSIHSPRSVRVDSTRTERKAAEHRYTVGVNMAGSRDFGNRMGESCYVSDDESMRRTPAKTSPLSRSMSFCVGTTPGKQYPSRMSISPTASAGIKTPRRSLASAMKTPSRSSARKKEQGHADPMSICKPSTAGKENRSSPNQSRFRFSSPSPVPSRGLNGCSRFHEGSSEDIHVHDDAASAYDRMPPPMPRTPSGKGCFTPGIARSAPTSPLQRHNPNQSSSSESFGTPRRGAHGRGNGARQGRTPKQAESDNQAQPLSSPAQRTPTSSRVRSFNLGSADGREHGDNNGGGRLHSQTTPRGAAAAAARCAPTPPRRTRAGVPAGFGVGTGGRTTRPPSVSRPSSGASHQAAGLGQTENPTGENETTGSGFHELLAGRAREFAEQASAEAMVGMPREAARGFTRALRIVPNGWPGRSELLLARARVLSTLSKHEACATDCRAALQLDPTLLGGITLLGHACLRLGLHEKALGYLQEGLTLAMSHPDASVRAEAQHACRAGIEEASLVGSALESGARAAGHGQHEAALAASGRVLEIAPQCAAGQEMRAAALLGALRPVECVCLCEAACLRPRADPEDDSDWPPARSEQPAALPPVLAALGMGTGVARYYVSALRGCGREAEATPAAQALRCRDPSLTWCVEDTARWAMVANLKVEGQKREAAGDSDGAVANFTRALEVDPGAVLPNAEAFCLRGSTRLGQGKALEALDDCYRALSLVSVEGSAERSSGNPFALARARTLLIRGKSYLALSRLGEAVSDLQGCVKCDPGLHAEAAVHLARAEQRQSEAGVQRRVRERQERERQERQAAAAAATAAAAARAEEEARTSARASRAQERAKAGRKGFGEDDDATSGGARRRNPLSPLSGRGNNTSSNCGTNGTSGQRSTSSGSSKCAGYSTPGPTGSSGSARCKGDDVVKTPAREDGLDRTPKVESESYYRRLGLHKDASEVAIKKAYRKLALRYHPDKNRSADAAHSFRLVSEAYKILTSPDSKFQYDRAHRYSIETPPSSGWGGSRGGGGGSKAGSRSGRGQGRDDETYGYPSGRDYGSGNGRGTYHSRSERSYW